MLGYFDNAIPWLNEDVYILPKRWALFRIACSLISHIIRVIPKSWRGAF
jgi:hypothetical protein